MVKDKNKNNNKNNSSNSLVFGWWPQTKMSLCNRSPNLWLLCHTGKMSFDWKAWHARTSLLPQLWNIICSPALIVLSSTRFLFHWKNLGMKFFCVCWEKPGSAAALKTKDNFCLTGDDTINKNKARTCSYYFEGREIIYRIKIKCYSFRW